MPTANYRIYRGNLKIFERDAAGWPINGRDLGETPRFAVQTALSFADNYETATALTKRDLHLITRLDMSASLTLKEASKENLALLLKGAVVAVAATPFTNLLFRTGVLAGDVDALPGGQVNLSVATITDSAGSPVTLAVGTNYTIDKLNGTVTWVNVTGFTQPFKLGGTPIAHSYVSMLTDVGKEYSLRFEGINLAERPNTKKLVELYRVVFDAPQEVKYKDGESNEVIMYEIPVIPLADDTKPASSLFGQFGREVPLG